MSVIENSIEVYKNMAKARTQDCINYKKELERYKNIIDELEKFIKTQQELYRIILSKRPENDSEHNVYYSTLAGNEQLSIILNKLKELKGE